MAKYRAKITVHCRAFWLPYKNYCGDHLPCNNYRALPWWLATVQSIPWLPITVHQLLCNTMVAAYRGKHYREEKSLPRKALSFLSVFLIKLYLASHPLASSYSRVTVSPKKMLSHFFLFVHVDWAPLRLGICLELVSISALIFVSFVKTLRRLDESSQFIPVFFCESPSSH